MTVILQTTRAPVTKTLAGRAAGATVTLRRLIAPDYQNCLARAMALLSDTEALVVILDRHDLIRSGRELKTILTDPHANAGLAKWLCDVECGIEAIDGWTGFEVEPGRPAPLARDRTTIAGVADPRDPTDLLARIAMETLMLDEELGQQIMREIDLAARILAAEGKGSGVSESGTAGPAPTAGTPTGVAAAGN